jgi:hypothetical protein
MVLVTPAGPREKYHAKRGEGVQVVIAGGDEIIKRESYMRCPVPGCFRVAGRIKAPGPEPTHKLCPKCHKPTDAPESRLSMFNYRCMACTRKDQKRWAMCRQAKKNRERVAQQGA